jgi:type I site-specific restriction endonuclease
VLEGLCDKIDKLDEQRTEAVRYSYQLQMERWKDVCASEVFQELKHGKFKLVLHLLQNQEISVGKCAEAIAEIAHGCTPRLPSDYPDFREPSEALEQALTRAEQAISERDALRAENERLRDALRECVDVMPLIGWKPIRNLDEIISRAVSLLESTQPAPDQKGKP